MRRMVVSLLITSAGALLAAVAPAQNAVSQDTDIEQQMKRRRFVVQPKPDPQMITQDIDRVTELLAAQQRFDRAVRDSVSPLHRRPDLDYDVRSGIQSRNLRGLRVPLR